MLLVLSGQAASCANTLNSHILTEIPRVRLPLVMKDYCPTAIEFTYVPAYGSYENLQGLVRCDNPANYKVAVYIFVSGWWNKPFWDPSLTLVDNNGTWVCDIVTVEGSDENATRIIAFLVPNGYNPPLLHGANVFPLELYEKAVAYVEVEREES